MLSQVFNRSTAIRRNAFGYRPTRCFPTCSAFPCKVCLTELSQVWGSVHYQVSGPGGYTLRQLVDANIDRRPIVVCGGVKEGDASLEAVYDRWPIGLRDQ